MYTCPTKFGGQIIFRNLKRAITNRRAAWKNYGQADGSIYPEKASAANDRAVSLVPAEELRRRPSFVQHRPPAEIETVRMAYKRCSVQDSRCGGECGGLALCKSAVPKLLYTRQQTRGVPAVEAGITKGTVVVCLRSTRTSWR